MPLINSNTLNEWAMGIPQRARGLLADIKDAPRQIGLLFDPAFQKGLLDQRSVTDTFDKQKAEQLAMDLLQTTPVGNIAGMIKGPLGRIPENYIDANKLADMLERAGRRKGYDIVREGSAISPSQYLTFNKVGDDTGSLTRQVRISNHTDKYPELARGVRVSVDPATGITYEQAVNWLGREGYPTALANKYKEIPSWEQYYKNQQSLRDSPEQKLKSMIAGWGNLPKKTRGPMPTIEDINNGITFLDILKRGK